MSEPIEKTEAAKPEEVAAEDVAANRRIEQVANEAAGKSIRTVKKYDNQGPTIFSK